MVRIIVNGAAGRMGKTIIKLAASDRGFELVGAADSPSSTFIGKDSGETAGVAENGIIIKENLRETISNCDVIIDFSSPNATPYLLNAALASKKAVVIGTTGHSPEQKAKLNEAAKSIPLLVSPNMSVGINLLWKLSEITSKTLGRDYKIFIKETHHIHKKDAPSGTAKKILEIVANMQGYDITKDVTYDETSANAPISVKSVREGEVVGNHVLSFISKEDCLTLEHNAENRDIFAKGALKAAKWIVDKPIGLYNMQDVLF